MFEDFPVVTNESQQKLKMDVIANIQDNDSVKSGLNCQQQLFSRLLTSINPFAQFVVQELTEQSTGAKSSSEKCWELDEAIFKKPPGTVKKESLYRTSAEMFSIYIYAKDPMMQIKSDKYTGGEFKRVKDLISLDDNLLVSSQMSNHLLLEEQQAKLIQKAKSASPFTAIKPEEAAPKPQPEEDEQEDDNEALEEDEERSEEREASADPPNT